MRRIVVLAMVTLLGTMFAALAQEGEPMANPDCTAAALTDAAAQIDELYADAQTALAAGDVRTWLENLRAVSVLTGSLRAYCDGYVFEGDAEGSESQVIGPVTFQPGVYTVTLTTAGFVIVDFEELSGDCGRLHFSLSEGEATNGAQAIFRVDGQTCTALMELSLLSAPWRLEFTLVSAGD